ncbi:hypothetical protein TNCV_1282501 [Trichonephila clavipes]|uniref:Uncharacterized protein n=1 Tax=Trichonephila clavipes TaxID=2585209 RepID=A0A8X6SKU6_TRICX|nr:hypothetical protein TNCV_1282501 [Trichonephila clavipes]
MILRVVAWEGIILNVCSELNVFDSCSASRDRYYKEGILPHVHQYLGAFRPATGKEHPTEIDTDRGMITLTSRTVGQSGVEYGEMV